MMNATSHSASEADGIVCVGPRMQMLDRCNPDIEPALKVLTCQGDFVVEYCVHTKCVAPICAGTKEERLPKITHDWHVLFKVHLGNINENMAEQLIGKRTCIERLNERCDVVTILDIGAHYRFHCVQSIEPQ